MVYAKLQPHLLHRQEVVRVRLVPRVMRLRLGSWDWSEWVSFHDLVQDLKRENPNKSSLKGAGDRRRAKQFVCMDCFSG